MVYTNIEVNRMKKIFSWAIKLREVAFDLLKESLAAVTDVLATGSSPIAPYQEMVESDVDFFGTFYSVNLTEYVGLAPALASRKLLCLYEGSTPFDAGHLRELLLYLTAWLKIYEQAAMIVMTSVPRCHWPANLRYREVMDILDLMSQY